jgi:hypothetical protein
MCRVFRDNDSSLLYDDLGFPGGTTGCEDANGSPSSAIVVIMFQFISDIHHQHNSEPTVH